MAEARALGRGAPAAAGAAAAAVAISVIAVAVSAVVQTQPARAAGAAAVGSSRQQRRRSPAAGCRAAHHTAARCATARRAAAAGGGSVARLSLEVEVVLACVQATLASTTVLAPLILQAVRKQRRLPQRLHACMRRACAPARWWWECAGPGSFGRLGLGRQGVGAACLQRHGPCEETQTSALSRKQLPLARLGLQALFPSIHQPPDQSRSSPT